MTVLFHLLSLLLGLAALPFFALHPKMRGVTAQRLGRVPQLGPSSAGRPRYWLHGASAGDVLALVPTARALRGMATPCDIVVSAMTRSGLTMAKKYPELFDAVFAAPLDVPFVTRWVVQRIRPTVLVLEYTELWPQLIGAAFRARVPIALHNGRIGPNSLRRYRCLFALTGNLLARLSLSMMRDEDEAKRAIQLGADAARVVVTGNTKFDNLSVAPNSVAMAHLLGQTGWPSEAPILVLGSTHDGEEEPLLDIFVQLKASQPDLRLILAPRYKERANKLADFCAQRKLVVMMRKAAPRPRPEPIDVLILNTVGELMACYGLARMVFVGGSFVPRGGQNILEPASAGKPVLFGPHMNNFRDAVAVLVGRGGIQVATYKQLQDVLADLLQAPQTCRALGDVAQKQVRAVRGAASHNGALLDQLAKSACVSA